MKLFQRKIPAIRVGAMTSTGKVREENQDNMSRFFSPLGEVFVVADGMGGQKGGALAADMVTRGLEEELSRVVGGLPIPTALRAVTQIVNEAIHQEATSGNPETEKMGSTVVLAVLSDGFITVGHVGDSRAYLFRNGRLERLTRDHSRIQKLVDSGLMTEAEGREHPDASILNRNMGGKPTVEMEVSQPIEIQEGDVFLLCTDGLCGYLLDEAIGRTMAPITEAQATADALVELALQAGGEDNVTVQVIQCGQRKPTAYLPAPSPRTAQPAPARPRKFNWVWIAGVVTLLVAVLAGGLLLGIWSPWKADPPKETPKADKPKPSHSTPSKPAPGDTKPAAQAGEEKTGAEFVGEKENSGAEILVVLGQLSSKEQTDVTAVIHSKGGIVQNDSEKAAYLGRGPIIWFVNGNHRGEMALKLKKALGNPDIQAKPMPKDVEKDFPVAKFVIVAAPSSLDGSRNPPPLSDTKKRKTP